MNTANQFFSNGFGKVKNFILRVGRRNWIIIGAAVLVTGAVLLNFLLFAGDGGEKNPVADLDLSATPIASGESENTDDYFAMTQISRQRARDEAIDVLQTVVDSDDALEEAKCAALAGISKIAEEIEAEANIEMLVKSKGISECIAVISGDVASVIVRSDGLIPSEIAQITEIVYTEAGIEPTNLNIIQKKNN